MMIIIMMMMRRSHFLWTCTGHMPCPRMSPERRHALCASLLSRNALQHFARATLFGHLQEKSRAPDPQAHTQCEPAQSKRMSRVQVLYTEIYRKDAAPQSRGADLVRAYTAEIDFNMSQEPLDTKFTGKMPRPSWGTLIKHRPLLLLLAQEPPSVDTLFGEKTVG